MSYLTIKEDNTYLVNNKVPINIINYVKEINKIEYKLEDISFIDDFIKLVHRKDFCIHHSMLQKYGILSLKDTTDVKRLLNRHKFAINIDYIVTETVEPPPISEGFLNFKKFYSFLYFLYNIYNIMINYKYNKYKNKYKYKKYKDQTGGVFGDPLEKVPPPSQYGI